MVCPRYRSRPELNLRASIYLNFYKLDADVFYPNLDLIDEKVARSVKKGHGRVSGHREDMPNIPILRIPLSGTLRGPSEQQV